MRRCAKYVTVAPLFKKMHLVQDVLVEMHRLPTTDAATLTTQVYVCLFTAELCTNENDVFKTL